MFVQCHVYKLLFTVFYFYVYIIIMCYNYVMDMMLQSDTTHDCKFVYNIFEFIV